MPGLTQFSEPERIVHDCSGGTLQSAESRSWCGRRSAPSFSGQTWHKRNGHGLWPVASQHRWPQKGQACTVEPHVHQESEAQWVKDAPPPTQLWSLGDISHTPLTMRVIGKKQAQNRRTSTRSAKKRSPRPAHSNSFFRTPVSLIASRVDWPKDMRQDIPHIHHHLCRPQGSAHFPDGGDDRQRTPKSGRHAGICRRI
jgi:hypothetical protein